MLLMKEQHLNIIDQVLRYRLTRSKLVALGNKTDKYGPLSENKVSFTRTYFKNVDINWVYDCIIKERTPEDLLEHIQHLSQFKNNLSDLRTKVNEWARIAFSTSSCVRDYAFHLIKNIPKIQLEDFSYKFLNELYGFIDKS